MPNYKKWQGIRARDVQRAKRDGVVATGPGWVEFRNDFGSSLYHEMFDSAGNMRALEAYEASAERLASMFPPDGA